MAGKITGTFLNLGGQQRGSQGLGLTVFLMVVIVATMIFSFWICRAGPFSAGNEAEAVDSMRFHAVNNPGASAFGSSGSENYSSDVTQIFDKLNKSTNASSQ